MDPLRVVCWLCFVAGALDDKEEERNTKDESLKKKDPVAKAAPDTRLVDLARKKFASLKIESPLQKFDQSQDGAIVERMCVFLIKGRVGKWWLAGIETILLKYQDPSILTRLLIASFFPHFQMCSS